MKVCRFIFYPAFVTTAFISPPDPKAAAADSEQTEAPMPEPDASSNPAYPDLDGPLEPGNTGTAFFLVLYVFEHSLKISR